MMKNVGLSLGGGGARGLAHIGILRVLEREGVPVHCVAGTSMGAIIGACYAATRDVALIERLLAAALSNPLFGKLTTGILREQRSPEEKKTLFERAQEFVQSGFIHIIEETRYAFFTQEHLESIVNTVVPDIDIRETRIPFACVATDLTNGTGKIFTKGPLRRCVLASASIPGVFPPVEIDGIYYSDGGAVCVTPVRAARLLGGRFVIASDVKSSILRWDKPEKAKDIVARCNSITGILLHDIHLKEADAVISPSVKLVHWSEFDQADFLIREGEKAAAAAVPGIRLKMRSLPFMDFFRQLFRLPAGEEGQV